MKRCDLSVIVITKNEERNLPKLLDSLKAQTFKDFEIIVSDAKSTDKTRQIARRYGCKVVNGGLPSEGRNNGVKASKAPVLLFLDADTLLPPSFLEENLSEFWWHDIDCATTLYRPYPFSVIDDVLFEVYNFWQFCTQTFWPHAAGFCIFVNKLNYYKVGGFNERILYAEDMDFVNRIHKNGGKFRVIINSPIYTSTRRLESEGRCRFVTRMITSGVKRMIYGDREKPLANYKLHGNDKDVVDIYAERKRKRFH